MWIDDYLVSLLSPLIVSWLSLLVAINKMLQSTACGRKDIIVGMLSVTSNFVTNICLVTFVFYYAIDGILLERLWLTAVSLL